LQELSGVRKNIGSTKTMNQMLVNGPADGIALVA